MRTLPTTVITVCLGACLFAAEASAFGDVCRREVRARGSVQSNFWGANQAAIAAWQTAAARQHGSRFGNWFYSGDRTVDCRWDASGRRIQCTAFATPCAPRG
jgi:hypothetical protein